MSIIIIYATRYGTTKRYADELGRRLKASVVDIKQLQSLTDYDIIVHLGPLFASGTTGLKKTLQLLPKEQKFQFIVATVGLSDPTEQANIDSIRLRLQQTISTELYQQAHIFHLRGGMDYNQLSLPHRLMMKAVYSKAKKTPPEQQTAETQEMMATYNKHVDFVDFETLQPIIDTIQQLN